MDDAELVRLILAGNKDAYADLALRWAGRVTALCHARLARADLAEELAQETLVRGFEELPEELRVVLMLFYYQPVTYRDIAHLLDVSTATVNARLTRARALLKARL